MKIYRIKISSWTASFRYPNLISGYQPTLDVPPISTVLGLLNAAAGKYLDHSQLKIGYYFEYEAKATDLETIYQIQLTTTKTGSFPSNSVKSNVIKREFLYNCQLYIYLQDEELVKYLRKPYFSLVIGRSGDLATVETIDEIELTKNSSPENLKGQIIPFTGNYLPGEIQALPKYFTNSIPRNNIGTEPYSVISSYAGNIENENTNIEAYTDIIDEKEVDIYFHDLNFVE
ncbi:MAG: type I-B CRISPR-associated protein Cas5 [Bacteroidales bacterium]|nr:type I-B CRISPR-associated protein Cas5 [Bacteroidales bacterium]